MKRIVEWLQASIVRQFMMVFGSVTALVIVVAVPALMVTQELSGSGGAINMSGSLRMQSYKIALAAADPFEREADRRQLIARESAEFEKRLMSPNIQRAVPSDPEDPLRIAYDRLKRRWHVEMVPLAMGSITSEAKRRELLETVPRFGVEVEGFVNQLDVRLNHRLNLLRWLLVTVLVVASVVTLGMLSWLQAGIFEPLLLIEGAANRVRHGDLSRRVNMKGDNEIGRLANTFDFMVDELERLYGNLEDEVIKKTQTLNRNNQGLHWVNDVSFLLSEGEQPDWKALGKLFDRGCALLQVGGIALVREHDTEKAVLAASSYFAFEKEGVTALRYTLNPVAKKRRPGESDIDYVLWVLSPQTDSEVWVAEILSVLEQTLGRHLERINRLFDDRRLAVLEERSTIARELHDSIAQSLSFTRIQLHRLKLLMKRDDKDAVDATVKELENGITTAYRQLREVLTAFRIRISSADLVQGVAQAVEEFKQRTGIQVTVNAELAGLTLTPNAQVHAIHILSEALVNIEKHARATHVQVTLTREGNEAVLRIEDNGVGIAGNGEKPGHYGLSIMQERAQAIEGRVTIESAPDKGTTVILTIALAKSVLGYVPEGENNG